MKKRPYNLYSSLHGMTKIKVKEVLKGIEPLAILYEIYQTGKDKNN